MNLDILFFRVQLRSRSSYVVVVLFVIYFWLLIGLVWDGEIYGFFLVEGGKMGRLYFFSWLEGLRDRQGGVEDY